MQQNIDHMSNNPLFFEFWLKFKHEHSKKIT